MQKSLCLDGRLPRLVNRVFPENIEHWTDGRAIRKQAIAIGKLRGSRIGTATFRISKHNSGAKMAEAKRLLQEFMRSGRL